MTLKQQLFVQEYLIDLNATQAAIRAGYSAKTAKSIGQRLLTFVDVDKAIQKAFKEREQRTEITQDRILKELSLIAFSDMQDYIVINDDGSVQAKTWDQMPEGASRAVAEVKEIRRIMTAGKGSGEEILLECRLGYKHHSKVAALELLGNHLGMWKDKQEVFFPDVETFELPKLTAGKGGNSGNGGHSD